MAAPSVGTRTLPNGLKLDDGYQSLFVMSNVPDLDIWEKTVMPAAMDGGDPINTDTMINALYSTKRPQWLTEYDDGVVVAAYDPGALSTMQAQVNEEQAISYLYPEGSAYAHWGYPRRFEFSPLTKGEPPEVTITTVVTNWDPINCVEAGPVFVDGTGSCHQG